MPRGDTDRLTGRSPPDGTGLPTGTGTPSAATRSTEISSLPASTASRYRPSGLDCSAPCEPSPPPAPLPPAVNGEPGVGVSEPSACRSKPTTVFSPASLPFT